ncbi:hypothetical protein [Kribbella catacumbae]|uniref:hypothetical protein n=1 Tax=Kribbella catacumbae TaxID=460086 RepID=UPI001ED99163|nr:hypothetical protein [Kribbella catacumbae]
MPGEVGAQVGVKVVSVSPDNATHGLPRIHGLVVRLHEGPAQTGVPIVWSRARLMWLPRAS